MAKTMNLGKVAMTTAGAYDSSKSYERLTCVLYNHVSWVSRKEVPVGIVPGTNELYWQKVSERGEQGIQGPVGPQGNSAFDGNGVEIVNNLTQGGEAAVLSAEQGKVLDNKLTELSGEINGIDIYRGDEKMHINVEYEVLQGRVTTSDNLFTITATGWDSMFFPVVAGQNYIIKATQVTDYSNAFGLISWIPKYENGVMGVVLHDMSLAGAYSESYTPNEDGYIIIQYKCNNNIYTENIEVLQESKKNGFIDFKALISESGQSLTKQIQNVSEELSIYREIKEVIPEEKPYAVYADANFLAITSNYTSLVYPVRKGVQYCISTNILRLNSSVAAISFLIADTYPLKDTNVDIVLKTMDKVGTYEIDFTPSQNGYIIIAKIVSGNNGCENQIVKYRGGEYIDFNEIISQLGIGENSLSKESYITLPIPHLATVNIISNFMPTTKKDEIHAVLEYRDVFGNTFVKNIIMNAQGKSSLGFAKKNISIDFVDESYEDSHEIKFGGWVAQDGYHLKSYMLDGLRVKPLAAYDFYESILLANPITSNRAWKRALLPVDIPYLGNTIEGAELQINDSAKCHPMGFPIILLHNGEFYGIYCWQLKKHRKNYHQDKNEAGHIHLDGNISNTLLWDAKGTIDWDRWSGKKAESDSDTNMEGIEIRNPKTLILVDGTKYDGDDNRGELVSITSPNYDGSNADMVRTAAVRASIESLSRRVYEVTQMEKGADKKSAIAEVFDIYSIIDYIIFSQITANVDGYKKNWQWITYDGTKWSVCAYDLDGTWGWSGWSNVYPTSTWLHNDTPPITLVIENFADEIKSRYAELRNAGVIELKKIMSPLIKYVQNVGVDYYEQEYEKWTDGGRDNLWRFEVWMEESIRRTDVLMNYTKQ